MNVNLKIKIILIIIIALVCGIFAYLDSPKSYYKTKIPKIDYSEPYKVTKVLDGDTFEIKVKNKNVLVRMLGIDTPETLDPRKPVQCFGKEASDKTKELLLNHSVKLETDPTQSKTDRYNRILAYVYRDDNLFINKFLLKNGYAYEYTYNIPYQKQTEFKELEKSAREARHGLWGSICLQK